MERAVIIGGGPAGLAMASCLSRRGIAYTLLERGAGLLTALGRLDPEMRMLTPTRLSRLPNIGPAPATDTYLRFADLHAWLRGYAAHEGVEAVVSAAVRTVTRIDGGYAVNSRLADGSTRRDVGRWVINCTGVAGSAVIPENFDPGNARMAWRHTRELRREHLRGVRRVLIVGGGTSAREALALWMEVGQHPGSAIVSLLAPVRSVPRKVFGVDAHYIAWLPEHLPATMPGARRFLRKDPTMGMGLSRALSSGAARQVGRILEYGRDHVVAAGGERIEIDSIVFATGYRYTLEHLGGLVRCDPGGLPIAVSCESPDSPGMFLLGLRLGRTIASPFLRGIATDARYVADRIAAQATARSAP